MQSSPPSPHRSFMVVSLTICAVIAMGLVVGWRWYFKALEAREIVKGLAAKRESKSRQMERLGLGTPASTGLPGAAVLPAGPVEEKIPLVEKDHPEKSQVEMLPVENAASAMQAGADLIAKFLATENWRDRVPYVHDARRVERLMEDYYENQGGIDPVPGEAVARGRYRIDGVEILHFSYRCNRPMNLLEIALRRSAGGQFLIDWESFVGYSEKSFPQLRRERSPEPVLLRAFLEQGDYYNYEFADRNKYFCVKLMDTHGDQSVFGYVVRDSDLGEWMVAQFEGAQAQQKTKGFTLFVSYPPKSESDQCVLITKVVANRWLILK